MPPQPKERENNHQTQDKGGATELCGDPNRKRGDGTSWEGNTYIFLSSFPVSVPQKPVSTGAHWPSHAPPLPFTPLQAQVGTDGRVNLEGKMKTLAKRKCVPVGSYSNIMKKIPPSNLTTGVSLVQIFSNIFLGGFCIIYGLKNAQFCSAFVGTCFKWGNTACIVKQLASSLNTMSQTLSVSARGDLPHHTCRASHSVVHRRLPGILLPALSWGRGRIVGPTLSDSGASVLQTRT